LSRLVLARLSSRRILHIQVSLADSLLEDCCIREFLRIEHLILPVLIPKAVLQNGSIVEREEALDVPLWAEAALVAVQGGADDGAGHVGELQIRKLGEVWLCWRLLA